MADYSGSNSSSNLGGNEKQVYADKIQRLVPGSRFRKIKKALSK